MLGGSDMITVKMEQVVDLIADSPLEGDGFELVVRRCVVGSRLADDIAEAPRPADLGGLRRWASAGMTKARCRVILGALPT